MVLMALTALMILMVLMALMMALSLSKPVLVDAILGILTAVSDGAGLCAVVDALAAVVLGNAFRNIAK